MVTSIILAGGRSLRLGRCKAVETICGKSLLERVIEKLKTISNQILVVTSQKKFGPPVACEAEVVVDIYPGKGWSYLYPSKWGGHKIGLLSSVSYLFGVIVAMGLLAQQAGVYCHVFVPFMSAKWLGVIILFLLMFLVLILAQPVQLILD